MKALSADERRKLQDITDMVAKNWTRFKKHGEFVAVAPTVATVSNSGTANFSDTGNRNGLLPELAKEREDAAFNDIRRLTIKEAIKTSLTGYIEKRNGQIRAAKNSIKRRFDFRQHDAK